MSLNQDSVEQLLSICIYTQLYARSSTSLTVRQAAGSDRTNVTDRDVTARIP